MKYLVIYMSKHGTTRKVAHQLVDKLGTDQTALVDIEHDDMPNLEEFSTIIIGGSIHIGHIQRKIRKFCEKHEQELLAKNLGLFLCFMSEDTGPQEFETVYPENLRNHAKAHGLMGGEMLVEEMNFIDKFIVKKVAGVTETVSKLDQEAIDKFAEAMREK